MEYMDESVVSFLRLLCAVLDTCLNFDFASCNHFSHKRESCVFFAPAVRRA